MIKVYFLIRRRPDLSYDQFLAHWRDKHGPMLQGVPQVNRHFARYAQNHLLDASQSDFGYDGVSVTWVSAAEDLAKAAAEPAFAPLWDDGTRFLDRSQSLVVAARADVVRGTGTGAFKVMEFFRKRPGVADADFHRALSAYVDSLWNAGLGAGQIELGLPSDLPTRQFGEGLVDAVAEFRFTTHAELDRFIQDPVRINYYNALSAILNRSSSLRGVVREVIWFEAKT